MTSGGEAPAALEAGSLDVLLPEALYVELDVAAGLDQRPVADLDVPTRTNPRSGLVTFQSDVVFGRPS
jgi:hypothetical protein